MTVSIKNEEKQFAVRFPTGLLLSSAVLSKVTDGERSITLTVKQKRAILSALRKMKKSHPDWCLVEVTTGGTFVKIKL